MLNKPMCMNLKEIAKIRTELFRDMPNVMFKLKDIYKNKEKIPLPNELFNNPNYEISYIDYKFDKNKSLEQVKKEIEDWVFLDIKNKRYFLGNFSYSLTYDNNLILFSFLTDAFNKKCIDLTGIVLCNSKMGKFSQNENIIIRFCIIKANPR